MPFEITSNCFIARQYANMALPLLPEVRPGVEGPGGEPQPLYVVELGAGHVRGSSTLSRR